MAEIVAELGARYQTVPDDEVRRFLTRLAARRWSAVGTELADGQPLRPAGRAHLPLPAGLRVLLQPAEHGRLRRRADHRRVAAGAGSRPATSGVLQCHLSGGEPLLRRDLVEIVAAANELGLYTNLVTSALGLSRREGRAAAGRRPGPRAGQHPGRRARRVRPDRGHARPSRARSRPWRLVKELGWPLTVNVVLHRQNIDRVADVLELAEEVGADRVELANTQYYGWAWRNRDALLPSRAQLEAAEVVVRAARERLRDRMDVIYVIPDYYSRYPKPCMGGWASAAADRDAERRRPALPGRPVPAVAAGQRARRPAGADLGRVAGDDRVPRDGLDAGSLPELRPARAGLRRMPLPGVPAHRRRRPHRPGLPPVARPRPRDGGGAGGERRNDRRRPSSCPVPTG